VRIDRHDLNSGVGRAPQDDRGPASEGPDLDDPPGRPHTGRGVREPLRLVGAEPALDVGEAV
jgi:hypothetical protein